MALPLPREIARSLTVAPVEKSGALLDLILGHAPSVAFVLDADGRVVSSNGRGAARLRQERGSSVGRLVAEMYADSPDVLAAVARALRGESFVTLARISGRTFECTYLPVMAGPGRVDRVIGVALDVTDRTSVERELATVEAELRDARRSMTTPRLRAHLGDRRVLLVSDTPLALYGLGALVDGALEQPTDRAASVDDISPCMAYDVVVVSCRNTMAAVQRLCAHADAPPVVAVPLRSMGSALIRAGAAGVVPRADAPDHLIDALRSVLRGRPYLSMESLADGHSSALSDREQHVVVCIARGYRPAEIAQYLALSRETVLTYRRRALDKLECRTDADLTWHALRQGWIGLHE